MDKIINAHIDSVEKLEDEFSAIVEREAKKIDIDEILAAPAAALSVVAERLRSIFLADFSDKAIELGFDFGRVVKKKIEQDKTIKIDDSKNPQLNATGESNK